MIFCADAHVEFSRYRFPSFSSAPIDPLTAARSVGGPTSVNVRLHVRGHECRNKKAPDKKVTSPSERRGLIVDFYLTSVTVNPLPPPSSNSRRTSSPGSVLSSTAGYGIRSRKFTRGPAPRVATSVIAFPLFSPARDASRLARIRAHPGIYLRRREDR